MAPQPLLDTHIHLWPSTATSPEDHAWMTPGHQLAQRHSISDFKSTTASSPVPPSGFVYVETDRYLPSLSPHFSPSESGEEKLKEWARGPLNELNFLRRIVEEKPEDGDGFSVGEGGLLKGLVIWAPFTLSISHFKTYLAISRDALGEKAWAKVVGFRYLLQGKGVEGAKSAVESAGFVENLLLIGGLGKAFDVGVDCHRDGVEVLDVVAGLVKKVRGQHGGKMVRFVLNHLCKPDLSPTPTSTWQSHSHWTNALSSFSSNPNVYMKLSGAFNEFSPSPTPSSPCDLISALTPYFEQVYQTFGAKRLMFASDWPVCNVGGPKGELEGEERNWSIWRSVVKGWMDSRDGAKGLTEEEKEWVWWRAGCEAYGIEGFGETESETVDVSA